MISTAEWAITIPDPATGAQLAASLDETIKAAREVLGDPPWARGGLDGPAPQFLRDADAVYARVLGLSEGFDVFARRTPDARWGSKDKPWQQAKAAGMDLLAKAAAAGKQLEQDTKDEAKKIVSRPQLPMLPHFGFDLEGLLPWAIAGGVIYYVVKKGRI